MLKTNWNPSLVVHNLHITFIMLPRYMLKSFKLRKCVCVCFYSSILLARSSTPSTWNDTVSQNIRSHCINRVLAKYPGLSIKRANKSSREFIYFTCRMNHTIYHTCFSPLSCTVLLWAGPLVPTPRPHKNNVFPLCCGFSFTTWSWNTQSMNQGLS